MEAVGIVDRIFHCAAVHGPTALGQGWLGGATCTPVIKCALVSLVAFVHALGLDVCAGTFCAADKTALGKPKARLAWCRDGMGLQEVLVMFQIYSKQAFVIGK